MLDARHRPGWDPYFLAVARAVAKRGDCRRRQVGAILVQGRRICATGYNGAPAGRPGCLDGHCPRGLASLDQVPRDAPYEGGEATCIAVHAEANALLYADRRDTEGGTLYLTDAPCAACRKLISGAGVIRVVWPHGVLLTAG